MIAVEYLGDRRYRIGRNGAVPLDPTGRRITATESGGSLHLRPLQRAFVG